MFLQPTQLKLKRPLSFYLAEQHSQQFEQKGTENLVANKEQCSSAIQPPDNNQDFKRLLTPGERISTSIQPNSFIIQSFIN